MAILERRIASDEDVAKFQAGKTFSDIVEFLMALNESCAGLEIGQLDPVSPQVEQLLDVLDKVDQLVEKHPAKPSTSRFGKPEYVGFYEALQSEAPQWLSCLTTHDEPAQYFGESFGNKLRIDYGSGHELNFLCFLLCLEKLGVTSPTDSSNLVVAVFAHYFRTMRHVQQTYWLEPAGSHGVWGLDDYHFLPYLFGSGQLVNDPFVTPISIHDEDIVDMYKDRNFYFWCIEFINKVKTASLRWHSPMLDDISGVKKWAKVNQGMIKMYKAEVLGKLPIIQHFLFGNLLPAPEGVTAAADIGEEVHVQCWADCCGIRVPSAIAAVGSRNETRGGHNLKKASAIPVD